MAEERFDMIDTDDQSYASSNSSCGSPVTPTSVLPQAYNASAKVSYAPAFPYQLRLQALGMLNPIEVKSLSPHMFPYIETKCSSPFIQKGEMTEEVNTGPQSDRNYKATPASGINKSEDCDENVKKLAELQVTNTSEIKFPPNVIAALGRPSSPILQPAPSEAQNTAAPAVVTPVPVVSPISQELQNGTEPLGLAPLTPSPPKSQNPAPSGSLPLLPPPLPTSTSGIPNTNAAQPLPPHNLAPYGPLPQPPPPLPSKISGIQNTNAPPPPMLSSKGSVPSAPSLAPPKIGGAPPPPPPLSAVNTLRAKKAASKLKRSSQMGSLYRVLKGKFEGSNQDGKSLNGRKGQIRSSTGGKQGMADALAEMTKRSLYFQQIEADVEKHSNSIMELKASINSFQTKDMVELLKFHKHVESQLENLTDETQVLARFEGFPTKRLEAIRTAAALYAKLDAVVTELENWKVVTPLGQLLDRVERYFSKIKGEVDRLERTKDEEGKKFRSQNIHFDFHILVRIKESMVDVSSSCMELTLKEKREIREKAAGRGTGGLASASGSAKLLWRAFQLAFRVYNFAGGQDDRADMLTRELAQEIETESQLR